MLDYLIGKIVEITPSYLVIDVANVGYFLNITLQTYSKLSLNSEAKLYIHSIIRDDAYILYGFADKEERELFRLLISVSGVGANTARLMLSTLSVEQLSQAIMNNDVALIKSVKGVGLKTAQRIIVDLKDKLGKPSETVPLPENTQQISEAITALVMLGFSKKAAQQAVRKVFKPGENLSVEQIIKHALKILSR